MTLWNPTIHPVTIHPHVPVTREYTIRDPAGNLVTAEVYNQEYRMEQNVDLSFSQYLPISNTTKNIPGRMSSAQNQYIFQASLSPLSFNTYYFEAKGSSVVMLKLSTDFLIFLATGTKKTEQKKILTTVNEACVLQNEVGHQLQ